MSYKEHYYRLPVSSGSYTNPAISSSNVTLLLCCLLLFQVGKEEQPRKSQLLDFSRCPDNFPPLRSVLLLLMCSDALSLSECAPQRSAAQFSCLRSALADVLLSEDATHGHSLSTNKSTALIPQLSAYPSLLLLLSLSLAFLLSVSLSHLGPSPLLS